MVAYRLTDHARGWQSIRQRNGMQQNACGKSQCYVCGESICDYDHFQYPGRSCPLYFNDDGEVWDAKIRKAQVDTATRLLEEKGLNEEDVGVEIRRSFEEHVQRRPGFPLFPNIPF